MSCHTALVITVQRCLCYLLHALCFSPVISPDFARRGCPELGMKEQAQQQQTCKQRLYNPFYTGLFKKRDLSICPLVYSTVSRCPPVLWSLSAAPAPALLVDRLLAQPPGLALARASSAEVSAAHTAWKLWLSTAFSTGGSRGCSDRS